MKMSDIPPQGEKSDSISQMVDGVDPYAIAAIAREKSDSISQMVDGVDFDAYAVAAIERGERGVAIASLNLAEEIDLAITLRATRALERQAAGVGERVHHAIEDAIRALDDRNQQPRPNGQPEQSNGGGRNLGLVTTGAPLCGMPFARVGYRPSGACARPRGHDGSHRK